MSSGTAEEGHVRNIRTEFLEQVYSETGVLVIPAKERGKEECEGDRD